MKSRLNLVDPNKNINGWLVQNNIICHVLCCRIYNYAESEIITLIMTLMSTEYFFYYIFIKRSIFFYSYECRKR